MIKDTKTEIKWEECSRSVCSEQSWKDGHQTLSRWRFSSTFSHLHFLNFLQVLCTIFVTRESHRSSFFLTRIWQQMKWAIPGARVTPLAGRRREEHGGGESPLWSPTELGPEVTGQRKSKGARASQFWGTSCSLVARLNFNNAFTEESHRAPVNARIVKLTCNLADGVFQMLIKWSLGTCNFLCL